MLLGYIGTLCVHNKHVERKSSQIYKDIVCTGRRNLGLFRLCGLVPKEI